ncbi:DCD (development and cell death) domain protein, partial [Trifolium medium]|nr:DCD (development and cell death) domain protein [Trifolium medium]
MDQEDGKNGAENPPEESSNPQTSEKDDSNKDTNAPEGSSKPESSDKKTPTSLKAKTKILKKSKAGKLKTVNKGSQKIGGKGKNKKVVGNVDEQPKEKSENVKNNKGKEVENGSTSGKSPIAKNEKAENN